MTDSPLDAPPSPQPPVRAPKVGRFTLGEALMGGIVGGAVLGGLVVASARPMPQPENHVCSMGGNLSMILEAKDGHPMATRTCVSGVEILVPGRYAPTAQRQHTEYKAASEAGQQASAGSAMEDGRVELRNETGGTVVISVARQYDGRRTETPR